MAIFWWDYLSQQTQWRKLRLKWAGGFFVFLWPLAFCTDVQMCADVNLHTLQCSFSTWSCSWWFPTNSLNGNLSSYCQATSVSTTKKFSCNINGLNECFSYFLPNIQNDTLSSIVNSEFWWALLQNLLTSFSSPWEVSTGIHFGLISISQVSVWNAAENKKKYFSKSPNNFAHSGVCPCAPVVPKGHWFLSV